MYQHSAEGKNGRKEIQSLAESFGLKPIQVITEWAGLPGSLLITNVCVTNVPKY